VFDSDKKLSQEFKPTLVWYGGKGSHVACTIKLNLTLCYRKFGVIDAQ
jgi:hypothetical protein